MNRDKEELLEAIDILINKRLGELEFNYKIEGKIIEIVSTDTYKVEIQNNISEIKSMNDTIYQVGDVVYIIVFNNNYSDKKILCKK